MEISMVFLKSIYSLILSGIRTFHYFTEMVPLLYKLNYRFHMNSSSFPMYDILPFPMLLSSYDVFVDFICHNKLQLPGDDTLIYIYIHTCFIQYVRTHLYKYCYKYFFSWELISLYFIFINNIYLKTQI
jgi:hypothetical protein